MPSKTIKNTKTTHKATPKIKQVSPPPMSITKDSITIFINGNMLTAGSSHKNFDKIKNAIKNKRFSGVAELFDLTKVVKEVSGGNVTIRGDKAYYGTIVLNNNMVERVFTLKKDGYDFTPLKNFLTNAMRNPNQQVRDGKLFTFTEKNNLTITPDGCFIAYKAVRNDWTDRYSGQIKNTIGETIKVPDEIVNKNINNTNSECSSVFYHVGGRGYVQRFGNFANGDRFLLVKVNPADVMRVPDNESGKCLVRAYTPFAELKGEALKNFVDKTEGNDYSSTTNDFFQESIISEKKAVSKATYHSKRDSNGRFVKAQ